VGCSQKKSVGALAGVKKGVGENKEKKKKRGKSASIYHLPWSRPKTRAKVLGQDREGKGDGVTGALRGGTLRSKGSLGRKRSSELPV